MKDVDTNGHQEKSRWWSVLILSVTLLIGIKRKAGKGKGMKKWARRKAIVELVWAYYYEGKATNRDMILRDPDLKTENFGTIDREIRYLIEEGLLKRTYRKGEFIPNGKSPPRTMEVYLRGAG